MISDAVLGVIVLAVFIPAAILVGAVVSRFRRAVTERDLTPLLPLLEDARPADGAGIMGGRLHGRYRGARVEAVSFPGTEVGSSSDGGGPRFTLFELSLLDVPGRQGWQVRLHERSARDGGTSWSLTADDDHLARALADAGAVAAVAALVRPDYTLARHGPVLEYLPRDARLVLRADADDRHAPPPAWVQQALDLLVHLAATNARLNPPAGG